MTLYVGFLKSAPAPASVRAVEACPTRSIHSLIHERELYWRCNKRFSDSTIKGPKLGKALGVAVDDAERHHDAQAGDAAAS